MHYVYILRSGSDRAEWYTGATGNLKARLAEHNSGKSSHTAKHRPWRIATYIGFSDEGKAVSFERYLKTGSGRAFAIGRLR